MARIRSIHPELCTDETLAEISAEAERTFVRLMPHLDDDGRAVDNPRLLKASLYPLHDNVTAADVDRWLWELARHGLILRYLHPKGRFLTAKPESWVKWQKPRWRYESKFPTPEDPESTEMPEPSDVRRNPSDVRRSGVVDGEGVGVVVGVERSASLSILKTSSSKALAIGHPGFDDDEEATQGETLA